jgi:hypothetical protein
VIRNDAMGGDYPSKPMSLYATIWDASNWATSGGKYKVNYKYAPFVAEFKDLALEGCPWTQFSKSRLLMFVLKRMLNLKAKILSS